MYMQQGIATADMSTYPVNTEIFAKLRIAPGPGLCYGSQLFCDTSTEISRKKYQKGQVELGHFEFTLQMDVNNSEQRCMPFFASISILCINNNII